MATRRQTGRGTAGRGTGRRKETPRIAVVPRRDSAAGRLIVRMAPTKQDGPRMQTGRRRRVLETAGCLKAGTHARTPRPITATGRRMRRRMVAAAPRMGNDRISRSHARVRRQVTTGRHTRTDRHTATAGAADRTRRLRVRTLRHRAPIPHLHVQTRPRVAVTPRLHLPIQRRAVVTPHLRVHTPRLAVATEAEAGAIRAVEAEARAAVEAAAPEAVGEGRTETVRTDIETFSSTSPPQKLGRAFFCSRICVPVSARNSSVEQVFSTVRKVGPFLIGHREKSR